MAVSAFGRSNSMLLRIQNDTRNMSMKQLVGVVVANTNRTGTAVCVLAVPNLPKV